MQHGSASAYKSGCRCDECVEAKRAKDREYYLRTREAKKAKTKERYWAKRDELLAYGKEYRERNADRLREYKRRYYEKNAEAVYERVKAWREVNPDARKGEYQRAKARDPEKLRQRGREAYYRARERDSEGYRAKRREYERNSEKVKFQRRIRNHQRRGLKHDAEAREYAAILLRDPCSYCGGPGGELDHIDPVVLGGGAEWSNLTSACRSCNASKNDRSLLAFLAA